MDQEWSKIQGICSWPLKSAIRALNADGSVNRTGSITCYVLRRVEILGKARLVRFLLADLGKETVILGFPWLSTANPKIDWASGQLDLRKSALPVDFLEKFKDGSNPNPSLPTELLPWKDRFDTAQGSKLPEHHPFDHAINLKPDFVPTRARIYPLSLDQEAMMNEFIDENLAKGYIRPSNSLQASPLFFVPKKDSKGRCVQDYRYLNKYMVPDAYPLPLIDDVLNGLKGCDWYTKMDLRSGYYQIRIKEGDEWKAAFVCKRGLFETLVMLFGLTNAPPTFQRFMDVTFDIHIRRHGAKAYIDDIGIGTKGSREKHLFVIAAILETARKAGIFFKLEKCQFAVDGSVGIDFLGFHVSREGITTVQDKNRTIEDWEPPRTPTGVRKFLGFAKLLSALHPQLLGDC